MSSISTNITMHGCTLDFDTCYRLNVWVPTKIQMLKPQLPLGLNQKRKVLRG